MSDKAEEIRDFLRTRRAMLDDVDNPLNYFVFLGVPEDASTEMIQRAYFDLAKQIHPDRLDRLGLADIKTEAGAIFQAITKAHEALSDIQQRLNKTPAERKAELETRRQARLDAMTPEQRQAAQQRIDRIEAVPIDKRPTFVQASRLAMVARSIKSQVDAGLKLDEVLAMLTTDETDAVNWLADQLIAERSA